MRHPESALFENHSLKAIADALLKRRKAIRYYADEFTLERGVDREDGIAFERLDLGIRRRDRQYHFTLWEDAVAWVWAGRLERKKGWILDVGFYAEVWELAGPDVVKRIERTTLHGTEPDVRSVWIPPERQSPSKKITR